MKSNGLCTSLLILNVGFLNVVVVVLFCYKNIPFWAIGKLISEIMFVLQI